MIFSDFNLVLTIALLRFDVEAEHRSQKFTVEILTDAKTGKIAGERWYDEHGRISRLGDLPAYIDYCPEAGVPIYQRWHRDGMAHRDGDKPSTVVTRADTGIVVAEAYSKLNLLHRDGDKPAIIDWDDKGRLVEQRYAQFGVYHRDQGPAFERFSVVSGKLLESQYWHNGTLRSEPSAPTLDPS